MYRRVRVYYEGRVQGVGFRFTAEYLAKDAGITGWVKNLRDGSVELVAEGSREALDELLSAINAKMRPYISDSAVEWGAYKGEFKDFDIRF